MIAEQLTTDCTDVSVDTLLSESDQWIDGFLQQPTWEGRLRAWGQRLNAQQRHGRDAVRHALAREIASLDARLSMQISKILHQQRFQELEASWRGLFYLVQHTADMPAVKVRVLCVSWRELCRDADGTMDFTQTSFYKKVYSEAFGIAGGEPFGLIVGDYYLSHQVDGEHSIADLDALAVLGEAAADAFTPFVTSVSPGFFGIDSMAQLDRPEQLSGRLGQVEYRKWNRLRGEDFSRFLGLVLPRILLRRPSRSDSRCGFVFRDDPATSSASEMLWGNPVWALASVVARSFDQTGWFLDVQGVREGACGGGWIADLPDDWCDRSLRDLQGRPVLEVVVGDHRERELTDLGLIPLSHLRFSSGCALFANPSIQAPKTYDTAAGTANAKLGAMLQYVLCVSRVAHYLKVMARDKVGTFMAAGELENFLQAWITNYVADDENAGGNTKARFPLKQAEVKVLEQPGRPGAFQCVMHLLPHSQWNAMTAHIQLRTQMTASRR